MQADLLYPANQIVKERATFSACCSLYILGLVCQVIFYPRVVLSVFLWLSPYSGITGSGLGASTEKNLDLLNLVVKERATCYLSSHCTGYSLVVNHFFARSSVTSAWR